MIRLGSTRVELGDGYTVTTFADGAEVVAAHDEQPGQAETAAKFGLSVQEMNKAHDLAHSLLARWLGLPHSPTLHAVAHGSAAEVWRQEEAAVLAVQAYAKAAGVDLIELAKSA